MATAPPPPRPLLLTRRGEIAPEGSGYANRILAKKTLSTDVYGLTVEAPLIARARKAGQFVTVQIDTDWGERIPLAVADADAAAGTMTLVFQIEKFGTVVCVGGGNVAMDAARMALRPGADRVHVVYRRTRDEMSARAEEVEHAMEEGIVFDFLRNPDRILGDASGRVIGMEVWKYGLGDPDASGRRSRLRVRLRLRYRHRRPRQRIEPLLVKTTEGLVVDRKGRIMVGADHKTSLDAVYGGGGHRARRRDGYPRDGRGPARGRRDKRAPRGRVKTDRVRYDWTRFLPAPLAT